MGLFRIDDSVVSRELQTKIKSIILSLPQKGLLHAFAYGSGVFQQQDRGLGSMIDLILVVDDVVSWHAMNLVDNYNHYSGTRMLGSGLIGHLHELGSGVYYNTYAQICGAIVKYGVISMRAFEEDLLEWKFMYVAGRLHKPVLHINLTYTLTSFFGRAWIESVIEKNHRAAVRLALLLLPQKFTKLQLYLTIAGFSYTGDSRMWLGGEKENKILALVVPIEQVFHGIYSNFLNVEFGWCIKPLKGKYFQCIDPNVRLQHLMKLPGNLQKKMVEVLKKENSFFNCPLFGGTSEMTSEQLELALTQLSHRCDLPSIVNTALGNIIFGASVRQTMVGFVSTGFYNSLYYAYEKYSRTRNG